MQLKDQRKSIISMDYNAIAPNTLKMSKHTHTHTQTHANKKTFLILHCIALKSTVVRHKSWQTGKESYRLEQGEELGGGRGKDC